MLKKALHLIVSLAAIAPVLIAQDPTEPWEIAIVGEPVTSAGLKEPHIAVDSLGRAFVVAVAGAYSSWAYYKNDVWTEPINSEEPTGYPISWGGTDRTVVYASGIDRFVIGHSNSIRRFDMNNEAWDTFGVEESLSIFEGFPARDKPWLVAGVNDGAESELYISSFESFFQSGLDLPLYYGRSSDGGSSWFEYAATDSETGLPIETAYAPQGTIARQDIDLPWYIMTPNAQAVPNLVYEFYQGDDLSHGVSFQRLKLSTGVPLRLAISQSNFNDFLPGGFMACGPAVPLASPKSASRLYVVYMDLCSECLSGTDVDIYCATFDRAPGSSWWALTRKVKVNKRLNPDTLVDEDQFLGGATVDEKGRIHVVYHDERQYSQGDGTPDTLWDAYYAVSSDHGVSFTEYPLHNANGATLIADFTLQNISGDELGEYQGITAVTSGGQTTVWMALIGTDPDDTVPGSNAKVVYVVRATHTP